MSQSSFINSFLTQACLRYNADDDPANWADAAQMLALQPGLAATNLYTAAAAGDPKALRQALLKDPESINTKGGPLNWEPLLYLTYGRVDGDPAHCDRLAATALLLEHGANPNAFWLWDATYVFTALTGAVGNGEGGLDRLPPLKQGWEIARLLLLNGANPNDGQALYNWMQTPGTQCLELMLEFGLNKKHRINWSKDNPMFTLDYLLWHSTIAGWSQRVGLLLENGANPNAVPEHGLSLYRLAIRHGRETSAQLLCQAGAIDNSTPSDHFWSACLRADQVGVKNLCQQHPKLIQNLSERDRQVFHEAARRNLCDIVILLLEMGFDVNAREADGYRLTPLHKAAMGGLADMVALLLERGADPHMRDVTYNSTPDGWAEHHGHKQVAEQIAKCKRG